VAKPEKEKEGEENGGRTRGLPLRVTQQLHYITLSQQSQREMREVLGENRVSWVADFNKGLTLQRKGNSWP